MARLDPGQQAILARIKRIGRQVGATPKEVKAAVETGLVESNLRNLPGGDADSAGWRQERASIYKDPTNLDASIRRFFHETRAVKDQYGSSGSLAAAVQRPAAQYRGRYAQRSGEASALLGGPGGTSGPSGPMRASAATAAPITRTSRELVTPAVDNQAARAALVFNFLSPTKSGQPRDLLNFATQSQALKDQPAVYSTKTVTTPGGGAGGGGGAVPSGGAGGLAATVTQRANTINAQALPYQWGGGHGGKTPINQAIPLDCSGAVSKVLGIDPRVSGDFAKWGRAGDGGSSGVTVYSNGHHVLMKINGHFFGTSHSNPGGGAGWIKQDNISPGYLQGFTARHSAR